MQIIDLLTLIMHITTVALLALLTIRVVQNLHFLRQAANPDTKSNNLPLVSVLIPARNESSTIDNCVESLATQTYAQLEILVLDDQSTDDTYVKLQQLAAKYEHVRIIQGSETPLPEWNGKSFACKRLAEQARGEWLLFTDADTKHAKNGILAGISQADHLGVSFLSAIPYQETKSVGERLMVSFIMDFLPLLGISLRRLTQAENEDAVANGQYVLVKTSAYREVGGHEAIIHALVDDFALAQQFVKHNQPIAFVNGTAMVACRMYRTNAEVWNGFTKNMLLALQTNRRWPWWAALAFAWGYVAVFTAPYWALITESNKLLPLIEVSWLSILRLAVGRTLSRPISEILLTPLSAIGVMALGLNTLYLKLRKRNVSWKGRSYDIRN